MSPIILYTILTVSTIGVLAAVILYFAAQKFKVFEDPRIDEVEEALPSANCGGCGFPGCRAFAEACVKTDDLDSMNCPVGGNDTMKSVAGILGKTVAEKAPRVAVVRCHGTCALRPRTNDYDGVTNCTIEHNLYGGDTGCTFGCLGHGECVDACDFEAIYMDEETKLPVVIDDACTACGACVEACPKDIIELRKKNKKDRKIFVSCVNKDKGALAKKNCEVACIGCSKCFKECKFDAIKIENFLAFIDSDKCVLCRKCVAVCPTNAIHEINFPAKKVRKAPVKKTVENTENQEVILTVRHKETDKKDIDNKN